MNAQELREKYYGLYDYMAQSRDPKNMKAFGRVMNDMMEVMLVKMPTEAEEMIEKLDSIKWKQYLTPKEAERIVANMNPKAPWSREVWNNAMDSLSLVKEEMPYYNRCALWVEMNKQYSDQAETVAELLGMPLQQIPTEKIVTAMYKMALNLLRDKDNVYNIRQYFGL